LAATWRSRNLVPQTVQHFRARVFSSGSVLTLPVTANSLPCLTTSSGTIAVRMQPTWDQTQSSNQGVVKVANGSNFYQLYWRGSFKSWAMGLGDGTHYPQASEAPFAYDSMPFNPGDTRCIIGAWDATDLYLNIGGREAVIALNTNTAALGTLINMALSTPQTLGPAMFSSVCKSQDWRYRLGTDSWDDPDYLFTQYMTDAGDTIYPLDGRNTGYMRMSTVASPVPACVPSFSPLLLPTSSAPDPNNIQIRSLVKVGSTYYLYSEFPVFGGTHWKVVVTTSTDGINWGSCSASLLGYGPGGGWYDEGFADPSVVYVGPGDWRMWVEAFNATDDAAHGVGVNQRFGYATSADGLAWTVQAQVLEVGTYGQWDDYEVHHPAVVLTGGVYHMFYAGRYHGLVGGNGVDFQIGHATSSDGQTWARVTSPANPCIPVGTWGVDPDGFSCRPSQPILIGSLWYMFYWGANYDTGLGASTQRTIMCATSPDLYTWTKRGPIWQPFGRWSVDNFVPGDVNLQPTGPAVALPLVEGGVLKMWTLFADAMAPLHGTVLVTMPLSALPT